MDHLLLPATQCSEATHHTQAAQGEAHGKFRRRQNYGREEDGEGQHEEEQSTPYQAEELGELICRGDAVQYTGTQRHLGLLLVERVQGTSLS